MSLSRVKSHRGWVLAATVGLCSLTRVAQAYDPYAPYGEYGCATPVPTLKTMQNHWWQSHQWRGDFPVCQPLFDPHFGHFGTRWRRFPGSECYDMRPPLRAAAPFAMPVPPAAQAATPQQPAATEKPQADNAAQ